MPVYNYKARSPAGESIDGSQEAANEELAVAALHSRELLVIRLKETAKAQETTGRGKKGHRRIKSDDLMFFLNQLVMLLEAGIPLLRSLEIISGLTESRRLHEVLGTVTDNIRSGSTFKDSMARHPAHFPHFWSYLIEAGETSGSLPVVLKELAKNVESNDALKKKIISALIYPAVLMLGAVATVLLFMLKIIPVFQKIFSQFHAKLPPLTQGIMLTSSFLQHYFLIFCLMIAVFIYALKAYVSTSIGRWTTDKFLLSVPVLGDAASDFVHARINIILSTLIKSGLNLLRSIEIAARASGNVIFENALNDVAQKVQEGKTLSQSLKEDPLFSPMMVQLIMIGEESGELPKLIAKAAKYYEEKVELLSSRLGVLIEPLILVLVGSMIGVLALGLFLPLFTLGTAIR